MNVRLTQEQKIKVLNSEDVYRVMQQVLLRENKIRRNQEHFWVVGLDNKNKILFIELISLGAVNRVQVAPPEIFRMAIYKLAVQMILVHNHPSGELTPSEGDKDVTDKMIKAGQMLNIEVIDHLIISEKEYFSMADKDIIEELKNSHNYVLMDREKALLVSMKIDAARESAQREIAKKLLGEGIDLNIIVKTTGLSKKEIAALKEE
ncbi:JAB domain-containing protein [Fulvivirga ulvae]|uniref:JAB domain-containing protein n=1 Tax=Fulvivirga ulvae TaxID=2904245 RepID=UPI001F3BE84F|nr:JAB domain-containing protein [Fulvivirga ulvae]UII30143.1 JAB domain-containing protein [Fulvivirga ulvae]